MATDNLSTQYLARPEGRIAYDVTGSGPLLVLAPGMGDLRSTYRFLAPLLVAAGYRVVTTDLRGHGDSDTTFTAYGDAETATDVLALVEALGAGPATIVGNSMAAGAGVIAAAERPDLVSALVLLGPFVRDPHVNPVLRGLMRVVLATPWIAVAWKAYLPTLYAGRRPDDFAEYRDRLVAALRRPGYARAFNRTTHLTHAPAQERLGDVKAASLVVMGALDPDFPDPAAEAQWIAQALHGSQVVVPQAGHYPQSQQPQAVADAVLPFLARVLADG